MLLVVGPLFSTLLKPALKPHGRGNILNVDVPFVGVKAGEIPGLKVSRK